MKGIYRITNKVNKRNYIGQSLDISKRWDCHKESLENNAHYNKWLQREWNMYGSDNFTFSLVAVLDETRVFEPFFEVILLIYENYFTKQYGEKTQCYNTEDTLALFKEGKIKRKIDYMEKYATYRRVEKYVDNGLELVGGMIREKALDYNEFLRVFKIDKDEFDSLAVRCKIDKMNLKNRGLLKYVNDMEFEITTSGGAALEKRFQKEKQKLKGYYANRKKDSSSNIVEENEIKLTKEEKLKILENEKIEREKSKIVTMREKEEISYQMESNGIKIKDFVERFTLTEHYNKVFTKFRGLGIFEYIRIGSSERKTNYVTEDYQHIFENVMCGFLEESISIYVKDEALAKELLLKHKLIKVEHFNKIKNN